MRSDDGRRWTHQTRATSVPERFSGIDDPNEFKKNETQTMKHYRLRLAATISVAICTTLASARNVVAQCQLQKLATGEPVENAFGSSISISGDLAVVGASGTDDACPNDPNCNSGSASVCRRDDNGTPFNPTDDSWIEEAKLTASDATSGDGFGSAA